VIALKKPSKALPDNVMNGYFVTPADHGKQRHHRLNGAGGPGGQLTGSSSNTGCWEAIAENASGREPAGTEKYR
jgi:hypothetical protein